MAQEVGKATVMVLLVLTIIVSVVGTWSVLSGIDNAQPDLIGLNNQASGQVQLRIAGEPPAPIVHTPQTTTGEVQLQVV